MHYRKSVFRSLAMVTQLGLCVITPVFLCVFIGYQLDVRFGLQTMIPLLILGVLGGARGAWQMAKRTLHTEVKEDEKLRKERMETTARAGVSRPKQPSRIQAAGKAASETDRKKEAD